MRKILDFFITKNREKSQKIVIVIVYILAAIVFNLRIFDTQSVINEFADERVHIAYVAYLEETGKIIPEFKDIPTLEHPSFVEENNYEEGSVNYLGHAPLYYHILKLFNIVKVDGNNVTYSLFALRLITQIISNIALFVGFYIGYKNIKSIIGTIIFAFGLVTVPLFSYVSSAVQNDALSFLGMNIYILGMLRFVKNEEEKKRDYLTYFIIALGCFICMLNKLTAGLFVIISFLIIFIYTMIKEKSIKPLICKEFFATIPVYLIILAYYLIIISRYGTINPSLPNIAPEYFKTTELYGGQIYLDKIPFDYYAKMYWTNFVRYWGGVDKNIGGIYSDVNEAKLPVIIFILPIIYLIFEIMEKKKINIVYYAVYFAVLAAIGIQFYKAWYEFRFVSGYTGGYHSRYYVCAMVPFLYLIAMIFESVFNIFKEEDKHEKTNKK